MSQLDKQNRISLTVLSRTTIGPIIFQRPQTAYIAHFQVLWIAANVSKG